MIFRHKSHLYTTPTHGQVHQLAFVRREMVHCSQIMLSIWVEWGDRAKTTRHKTNGKNRRPRGSIIGCNTQDAKRENTKTQNFVQNRQKRTPKSNITRTHSMTDTAIHRLRNTTAESTAVIIYSHYQILLFDFIKMCISPSILKKPNPMKPGANEKSLY